LIRINAKDVLEKIGISYCNNITGIGLEPIRGSTVLRRFVMRSGISRPVPTSDTESLVRTVESLFPFSTTCDSTPINNFPGLLHLKLPGRIDEKYIKKLHKLFRDNYTKHMKDCKLFCPKCKNSIQFWFESRSLHDMSVEMYCTKCHEHNENYLEYWDPEEEDGVDHVDLGMLDGCDFCNRDFDYKNSTICATCCGNNTTCCSDCLENGGNKMEFCDLCKIPSCSCCLEHNPGFYLGPLAIHKCHGKLVYVLLR
jgi:hypothetical protein